MEQLTLLLEEVPASHSQSLESEKGSKERPDSCSSTFDAFRNFVLAGFCGRTYRERSQARMGTLSGNCSAKWMNSGIVSHGEYWTRNSSEWPSDAVACSLSEVLETDVPQTYSLSQRACAGILRRAEKRGKPLPAELRESLERVAFASKEA